MSTWQFVALAAAVMLIAVLVWQWRERRRDEEIALLARAGGRYHCVEIRSRGRPCAAAQAFAGRRFLPRAAPPIPLPGCTAMSCRCAYVHFDDRRVGDRRSPFASRQAREMVADDLERRRRADRRRKPGLRTAEAI